MNFWTLFNHFFAMIYLETLVWEMHTWSRLSNVWAQISLDFPIYSMCEHAVSFLAWPFLPCTVENEIHLLQSTTTLVLKFSTFHCVISYLWLKWLEAHWLTHSQMTAAGRVAIEPCVLWQDPGSTPKRPPSSRFRAGAPHPWCPPSDAAKNLFRASVHLVNLFQFIDLIF